MSANVEAPWRTRYEVDPATGCWLWRGTIRYDGYGRYASWAAGRRTAHRWVYEQLVGPIPDGLELDHLCRVRACVNPDHLEPVTHAENMRRSKSSKLTPADVFQLRRDFEASGQSQTAFADANSARYGVAPNTIRDVLSGRQWADLADSSFRDDHESTPTALNPGEASFTGPASRRGEGSDPKDEAA